MEHLFFNFFLMWNILTELKNTQTESQVIKNKVVINFKKKVKVWTVFHYLIWQKIMSL